MADKTKPANYNGILLLIVLLEVCLLYAKSLPTAVVPPTDSTTGITNHSSCLPDQYKLDYYKELHRVNVSKGFNGNIMYYAFKTMEISKDCTESTITVDDNATISSISDPSRFTPAGMKTANKVICAKILQEMDRETKLISTTALCPWGYICDYKADRFPNYLFKARCKTSKCSGNCSQKNNRHNMCQSHGVHVTILQMRNCEEWVWGQELLPLACTCTNDIMMKVL